MVPGMKLRLEAQGLFYGHCTPTTTLPHSLPKQVLLQTADYPHVP